MVFCAPSYAVIKRSIDHRITVVYRYIDTTNLSLNKKKNDLTHTGNSYGNQLLYLYHLFILLVKTKVVFLLQASVIVFYAQNIFSRYSCRYYMCMRT